MRWLVLILLALPGLLRAEVIETSAGPATLERMAEGLEEPWALGFLPGGGFLVTLRGGELRHYAADGSFQVVDGVPQVFARGQGGLLDVLVPRDFAAYRMRGRAGRGRSTI